MPARNDSFFTKTSARRPPTARQPECSSPGTPRRWPSAPMAWRRRLFRQPPPPGARSTSAHRLARHAVAGATGGGRDCRRSLRLRESIEPAEVAQLVNAGLFNADTSLLAHPRSLGPVDQRSSLRLGSAIAFADGRVAVGAPIRGNGFAIVYPHESIASKEITVGSGQDVRAISNSWGPAVVTNLPAYQPSTIPIDVADLPVGYQPRRRDVRYRRTL